MKKIFLLIFIMGLMGVHSEVFAENILQELLKVKSFKCHPGRGNVAQVQDNEIIIQQAAWSTDSKRLTMILDSLDFKRGTARRINVDGEKELILYSGKGGLMFIEETIMGTYNTTVIFPEKVKGGYFSVHTNHFFSQAISDYLGRSAAPAQYYGYCDAMDNNGRVKEEDVDIYGNRGALWENNPNLPSKN